MFRKSSSSFFSFGSFGILEKSIILVYLDSCCSISLSRSFVLIFSSFYEKKIPLLLSILTGVDFFSSLGVVLGCEGLRVTAFKKFSKFILDFNFFSVFDLKILFFFFAALPLVCVFSSMAAPFLSAFFVLFFFFLAFLVFDFFVISETDLCFFFFSFGTPFFFFF